jgi:2-dehydro-3-deoxyphosphogluconate aldolase/(4S)-4-hydroxy-2-oxoglutarate aldolase
MPGLLLGVGTILNAKDAETFSNADFLVSPIISADLIDYTTVRNIFWIPGCSTASEIALAKNAGINLVKIFPVHLLGGTAFLKTMKDIFPTMKFLATGGIQADRDEISKWLNNGADAVGIGSQLFGKEIKDIHQISETLKQLLKGI